MTQEQKARAYDEALEHARQAYGTGAYDDQTLETIFPELRESEDERIRKGLIYFLQSPFIKERFTDEKVAPWIAYLEKQKEITPCDEEDITDFKHFAVLPSANELLKKYIDFLMTILMFMKQNSMEVSARR